MTVRVAVIGAGVMGGDHARIFAEDVPGAALQVVCDVSEASARRVADAHGAVDASTDAAATITRNDVDAVVIASPDATHAGLTLAALSRRKPVLCEKPLALTASECLEVIEAECATGRQLVQVGFMRRFDPSYVEIKAESLSGRLGAAIMLHNLHRNVEAPSGFSGMMAITNSAPHEFDAARYLLDAEITAISAFEPGHGGDGVCKPVVLILETSKGQLVTVEVNNNAGYGYDVRAELVCTHGSVSLGGVSSARVDRALTSATAYAADWRPRFAEAYRLQNRAWIKSMVSGAPAELAATAWDGYCATVIGEAGVRALGSGQKTVVELAQRPALYTGVGAAA